MLFVCLFACYLRIVWLYYVSFRFDVMLLICMLVYVICMLLFVVCVCVCLCVCSVSFLLCYVSCFCCMFVALYFICLRVSFLFIYHMLFICDASCRYYSVFVYIKRVVLSFPPLSQVSGLMPLMAPKWTFVINI